MLSDLDYQAYWRSEIDWDGLHALALRVARESRARRPEVEVTETREETRMVRSGFLGRSQRAETVEVTTTQRALANWWVLEERYWFRKRSHSSGGASATENTITYELTTSGELRQRVHTLEHFWAPSGQQTTRQSEADLFSPMREDAVTLLDFRSLVKDERDEDGEEFRTNQAASDYLLRPHKGNGLAGLLRRVLDPSG